MRFLLRRVLLEHVLLRRFCIFVFSFVFLLGGPFSTGLSVEAASPRISAEADLAGYNLAAVIELIVTEYKGGPISVNDLVEAALRGMAEELDQFSTYLSVEELAQLTGALDGRLVGIGVGMLLRQDGLIEITRIFPHSPALYAGMMAGDILVSVDGHMLAGLHVDEVAALITNPANERVYIVVRRGNSYHNFDILKGEVRSPTVILDRLEGMNEAAGLSGLDYFRYMQINSVSLTTSNDVRQAIADMQADGVRGIVLDLRGNSGGYLEVTIDIARQLVPQGVILQTVNQAGRRRTYSSALQEVPFEYIVVLVNRFTASAAEVIASALQDSGAAVVIGETTFGKGLVQSVYQLWTGGALRITTEEYFRRSGGSINDVGVVPCIVVERVEGSDAVLRRALEVLAG